MTDAQLSGEKRFHYEGIAELDAAVIYRTPLDGNSGHTSVRIDASQAAIWLGDHMRDGNSEQKLTIQAFGSNEHANLAQAFRDIADKLEREVLLMTQGDRGGRDDATQ